VGQGTGLGLSICYGIIRQHDGEMWLEAGSGAGATFHIDLPFVNPVAMEEPAGPESKYQAPTSGRILIVDDEPSIRNLLARVFETKDFVVDLAGSGDEALRMLVAERYDCVLLDLKMPGMKGQELYQSLQENDEEMARRVIFMTGDTVSWDTNTFIAATENPVLLKPFDLEDLRREIFQTIGLSMESS